MENNMTKTAPRTMKIGETVYEYVRTQRGPYGNEYVIRSQGYPTNGANKGSISIIKPWCSRPDFFYIETASSGCHFSQTLRRNPETGKLEDVTARIVESTIASAPDPHRVGEVVYYRTKTTFDGVAL